MFGAVDVGGTKTLVAIFDDAGKLIKGERFETPENYKDFLAELAKVVDNLSTKNISTFTVALPGLIDRAHGIARYFSNLNWVNVPVRDDIERIVHCPVTIENDAKLAGLYEAQLLKNEYKKVLYITISTGIGAGYCVNGSIDQNVQDMEVGSIMFEHDGKLQEWQHFASGKAIKKKFGKKASDITNPKDWETIAKNISVGVISLIATLTPEVIVFGGGVGAHFEKFSSGLERDLKKYSSRMLTIPNLAKAKKPEEAVLYGCFYRGKQKHESVS